VADRLTVVALDAMGGDYAPAEPVKGAVLAVNEAADVAIRLFGDEKKIRAELEKYTYDKDRITIVHCESVIDNCDVPTAAIRQKKDSSMVRGLYSVKNGEADAFVSCGNTGALLVGGQIIVGRLPGIERAALAFVVPSSKGPVLIIDCGANVDARPEMLLQFAMMASVYMKNMMGVADPRIGIINIGEEESKGNELVHGTIPLLKKCSTINYIGSVESRGITEGVADIVVCDAFVGNIILKMYEGVAALLLGKVKETMTANTMTKVGALMIKKELKKTLKQFSSKEYGGAPLLGLKALVAKTHGNSKCIEIKNTLLQCKSFAELDVVGQIASDLNVAAENDN